MAYRHAVALVSIHAPIKGATIAKLDDIIRSVFQSTHPQRVRLQHRIRRSSISCFNPHTPKGATIIENFLRLNYISFNPRTPKSATFSISSFLISFVVSIHASTKARDTLRVQIPPSAPNFNPRATHKV